MLTKIRNEIVVIYDTINQVLKVVDGIADAVAYVHEEYPPDYQDRVLIIRGEVFRITKEDK